MRARFAETSKIFSLSTTMKTRGNSHSVMQVTRDWSAGMLLTSSRLAGRNRIQRCQRSMIHCVTEGR